MTTPTNHTLFITCPCYNEAQGLEVFWNNLQSELLKIPDVTLAQVVMVDDGSHDETFDAIARLPTHSSKIKVYGVRFTKNFGHQTAIFAGLQFIFSQLQCKAEDTILIMDSDGQHPPRYISEALLERTNGWQHIQMIRDDSEAPRSSAFFSRMFYRVFRGLTEIDLKSGSADFRAFSGYLLECFLKFNELPVLNRAVFQWLGFPTKFIPYSPDRRIAGETKYSLRRKLKLAVTGLVYFTSKPLYFALSLITSLGFIVFGGYVLIEFVRVMTGTPFSPGWPTIIAAICFWGALNALGQFILGLYLASVFDETKKRPKYVIEKISGLHARILPSQAK